MIFSGFVTAARTLTWLPIPGREAASFASALPWFPLVGAFLGLALHGAALLTGQGWPGGTALLVVAGGTLLTRGLHLDGLADTADGLFGGRTRERALAIMKDSRMGAFGGIALVLALLAKLVAVSRLATLSATAWLVPAYVASRTVQAALSACMPYAREEGTAGAFVTAAGPRHAVGAIAAAMVILVGLGGPGWRWPAALGMALCVAILLGAGFRRRVGGITGDLLGAASELTETAVLLYGCVLVSP
jgi:adenosylcobinamide-GDP ribazoletransferase